MEGRSENSLEAQADGPRYDGLDEFVLDPQMGGPIVLDSAAAVQQTLRTKLESPNYLTPSLRRGKPLSAG
jgi:hypothetical protein